MAANNKLMIKARTDDMAGIAPVIWGRVDYRYNVSSTSRAADAAVRLLQSTVLP
jgi:hypothetical protein